MREILFRGKLNQNTANWRINGARDKPYLKGACLSKVIGNIHDNPELLDGVGNG